MASISTQTVRPEANDHLNYHAPLSQEVYSEASWPKRGEIHWVDYNYKTQRGSEMKKTCPSLVVSNDTQNEFDRQIMVAPLTSEEVAQVEEFEVLINNNAENGLARPSKILLHRLHTIDKAVRLKGLLGKANAKIMEKVNNTLKLTLALE